MPAPTADAEVLAFHKDTYVFDGLSIAYVLDEKYSERLVAGGVDGTNVTFALEEDWDAALRKAEQFLTKIEKTVILDILQLKQIEGLIFETVL